MGERSVHTAEVAGSSPAPPTIIGARQGREDMKRDMKSAAAAMALLGVCVFAWGGALAAGSSWRVVLDEGGAFAAAIVDQSRASAHTVPGVALLCDPKESGDKRKLEIYFAQWPQLSRPGYVSFRVTVNKKPITPKERLYLRAMHAGNPFYSFVGEKAAEILEVLLAADGSPIRLSDGHSFFEIPKTDAATARQLRDRLARCR